MKQEYIKDKRVDQMIKNTGVHDSTIFYSLFSFGVPLFYIAVYFICAVVFNLDLIYFSLILPYALIAYLIHSQLNHSFALNSDVLMVINPNKPYTLVKVYDKRSIKEITIDNEYIMWNIFFGRITSNCVTIESIDHESLKFFCINLARDAHDENVTEETIDSFNSTLKLKGYPVNWNLDN